MDPDGLPIVGAGVDYEQVGPVHQKRTLTFLNHFLIQTTTFLNHFATICDEKLENLLIRIQRLEASMCILEAKLASIPGLDDVALNNQSSPNHTNNSIQTSPNVQESSVSTEENSQAPLPSDPKDSEKDKPVLKISQVSLYAKYFKMVNMGVPVVAVKLKMSTEGVNPDLLDDPDAEAPPGSVSVEPTMAADQSDSSDLSD